MGGVVTNEGIKGVRLEVWRSQTLTVRAHDTDRPLHLPKPKRIDLRGDCPSGNRRRRRRPS